MQVSPQFQSLHVQRECPFGLIELTDHLTCCPAVIEIHRDRLTVERGLGTVDNPLVTNDLPPALELLQAYQVQLLDL